MKKIIIQASGKTIHAVLNETVASKDFEKRLPFRCGGHDSGIDYCCTASEGAYDPNETQTGWKNGDINLAGGWFALLYGGEEESFGYRDLMIIGRINEEDLPVVRSLPKAVDFVVDHDK